MSKNNHTLHVRAKSDRGFWRGGIRFHREATELRAADLTPDQLAAIRAEHGRGLIVTESNAAEANEKTDQVILVGSSKLSARIQIAEGVEAPLGDIVAIAFTAAAGRPELAVITPEDWNAEAFGEQREVLLQSTVDALQADPAIYQAFLDERGKVAAAARAAIAKAATAKAAGKQGKGAK